MKNLQKIREKEQKFSEKSLTLAESICIIGGTPTRGGTKGQARAERRKSRGTLPEPAFSAKTFRDAADARRKVSV